MFSVLELRLALLFDTSTFISLFESWDWIDCIVGMDFWFREMPIPTFEWVEILLFLELRFGSKIPVLLEFVKDCRESGNA